MKDRFAIDLGQILDEIFEATQNFGDAFKNGFTFHTKAKDGSFHWDENVDYYPYHNYPPANVYLKADRTMVLEFAIAGFEESGIELQFQGDYMVFSAKAPETHPEDDSVRYFKRRLKMKDISGQKYFVPEDKFDREKVKAVYKNGLLRVTIPSRENVDTKEGVKIEIVQEAAV